MKKIGKNAKLYLIGMIIGGITLGLTTVVADTIINSTNVAYKTTTVKAALDDLYGLTADDVWQKIYPIGSIYISVSSTNPSTLFGGTWVAFGEGRTLIGVGTGTDENSLSKTFAVNSTGGEYTHEIKNSELPAQKGKVRQADSNGDILGIESYAGITSPFSLDPKGGAVWLGVITTQVNSNSFGTSVLTFDNKGQNLAHNNIQPYISVYMWKRTA